MHQACQFEISYDPRAIPVALCATRIVLVTDKGVGGGQGNRTQLERDVLVFVMGSMTDGAVLVHGC